jgi:hypothetical protein
MLLRNQRPQNIKISILKGARANMDFYNNEKITRRKFVKGVTGAAVCCACFSLDCLAASEEEEEDKIRDGNAKVHLAAACGTYCGACPAYIAKHSEDAQIKMKLQKRFSSGPMKALKTIPPPNWMDGLLCDGCLSGGMLAAHCRSCNIRLCAANKQDDDRCSYCEELPCYRITYLINMDGGYLHRKEYLPNLEKIREMGVEEWVKYEEERWRCPQCGLPMSWYDAECAGCGEPRSEQLFPLSDVDMNESGITSGSINFETTPLCALVLANGQYMFTCGDSLGLYDLTIPLDENGEITLYGFCSGFSPFKTVLTPEEALDYEIQMTRAPADSRQMEIAFQTEPGTENPDRVRIWGTVTYDGQDLCAMVLANGQSMFSCGADLGTFDLEVRLDGNGEITLYCFCSGMAPYKYVFSP